MSADIISLTDRKAEKERHYSGEARCIRCKHEWVAVAKVGDIFLECPSCECISGVPKHPFMADEGCLIFVCENCTSEFFYIEKYKGETAICCGGCGDHKSIDDVFN